MSQAVVDVQHWSRPENRRMTKGARRRYCNPSVPRWLGHPVSASDITNVSSGTVDIAARSSVLADSNQSRYVDLGLAEYQWMEESSQRLRGRRKAVVRRCAFRSTASLAMRCVTAYICVGTRKRARASASGLGFRLQMWISRRCSGRV